MTGYYIEQAELPTTRALISQVFEELQTGVRSLSETITELLGGGWSGAAANQFSAGWQEWRAGADQVLAALYSEGQALQATATSYADSDSATAGVLDRLAGGSK